MMFYRVAPVSRVVVGHVRLLQWVLESAHVLWMDGCLKYGYSEKAKRFEKNLPLKRSIVQTFWKLHCVTKSLFFELETSNFGYLPIF